MKTPILGAEALARALALRDLTDPAGGPHAMQVLLERIREALAGAWSCPEIERRRHPIVGVADNYDRLHYPPDGAAREARYTRYVSSTTVLRTQTSAMIPPLLRDLAAAPPPDALLVCPGLVYRRDTIDRLHCGEPHQVDLWRIRSGPKLAPDDLAEMIRRVVDAVLPGVGHRVVPALHPYTTSGLQIDVEASGAWVEIGECGLALPAVFTEAGLSDAWSGLAMGLGLDRLLMLRKGIDDIRLLRSNDPRIASQMLDLEPYRPVSSQPATARDLSVAVAAETTPEELGDRVRAALDDEAARVVEAIEVVSETAREALPAAAIERIGLLEGQKNVLLRIVLRDLTRSLTHAEANVLRDRIYAAVHEGTVAQWASAPIAERRRR